MDPLQLLSMLGFHSAPSQVGAQPYDPWASAAMGLGDPAMLGTAPQTQPDAVPPPAVPAPPPPPAMPPGSQPMASVPNNPAAMAPAPGGSAAMPQGMPAGLPGISSRPDQTETGGQPVDPLSILSMIAGDPEASPSRQGGYGSGPSAPPARPSGGGSGSPAGPTGPAAPPSTAPVSKPEAAGGFGSRAVDDPVARSRLMQMLTIMGAQLMQPIPPGGNALGQVGKAIGAAVTYQDAMAQNDQKLSEARQERELMQQRLGLQGKSVAIDQQRANADTAMTSARIRDLNEKIKLIPDEGERLRLQNEVLKLQAIKIPAELDRQARMTEAQIDHLTAQSDQARAAAGTPQSRLEKGVLDALTKGGALQDGRIDPAATRAVLSAMPSAGFRDLTPEEEATLRKYYSDLTTVRKMKPADADEMVKSLMLQRKVFPRSFAAAR